MKYAFISWLGLLLSASVVEAQPVCVSEFEGLPPFEIGINFGTSALGDFDGDGNLDLTIGLRGFLGDGRGGVRETFELRGPLEVAFDIRYADFDADGYRDLAMVQFGSKELALFYGRPPEEHMLGLFEEAVTVDFSEFSQNVWHIELGDFNGDERPDVVGIARGGLPVLVFNEGERRFTSAGLRADHANHMLATGDFDGDGNVDIAGGSGADVDVVFGDGAGAFGPALHGFLQHDFRRVGGHRFRAADFDGDGRSDLVATGERWVLVYLGKGLEPGGRFPAASDFSLEVSGGARFIEIADVNRDRVLDVVALSETPTGSFSRVFYGQLSEAGLSFVAGPEESTRLSGHGAVLAVGDMNGDESLDLVLTTEDTNVGRVFLNLANCATGAVLAGDANADQLVNLSDALVILTHLFDGSELPCPAAADVNGDETINLTDALHLLTFLFNGGPAPVDPGVPSCDSE